MRVSAALLVLLAAAGCGSASGSGGGAEPASAETSRIEVVMTRTDKEGRMVMKGLLDYGRDVGEIRVELEGAAKEIPMAGEKGEQGDELRIFERTSYAEWKVQGREYWVSATEEPSTYPNEMIVPFPGTSDLDPRQAVSVILDAGEHVAAPAEDEVRGVPTTHYHVMVDPKKLARVLPGEERPNSDDPTQADGFPVEVWTDDEERARRIRIRDEMTGEDSMTLTYEFFDFGVKVDVRRPPEDEVISHEQLDRMIEPTPDEMRELCREELPEEECAQLEGEGG
jgi:hypothetical protein